MMHPAPALNLAVAMEHDRSARERAGRARLEREAAHARERGGDGIRSLTVRRARAEDAEALHRLAQLDGASPEGERLAALARAEGAPLLVAELDGERVAALDLDTGLLVADPFRPSAAAANLLRARARATSGAVERPRRRLVTALRARLG